MNTVHDHLTWLVGGEAGYGIAVMSQMFAKICARGGLNVFGYSEYPSLIRGGHNTAMIRVGNEEVKGHSDKIDLLIALNEETLQKQLAYMADGGVVIYDGESVNWDWSGSSHQVVSVPLARITKELEADRIMRNTVALGACIAVLEIDFSHIEEMLRGTFERKGDDVVNHNISVAKAGYEFVRTNSKVSLEKKLVMKSDSEKKIVISGNEAVALGAIRAGVKFMAAYPMTPVTSVMLTIAKYGDEYGIVMKHTEDEIAAMNMTIGAAHMGVRAMTASSGGGFALMGEALGMAAMTETPIVVVEGTRPGPSTGLPTWTDQADLRFVMHASQGEFDRVVMMPGDVDEAFWMTVSSFNLAEKYQMPVLILTDKYLGESIKSTLPFDSASYSVDRGLLMSMEEAAGLSEYNRFANTESGVSPRALPGYPNCIYTAATDEHNEFGDLDESSETRIMMVDKRARKMESLVKNENLHRYEVYGDAGAELLIVGWGSTKGPILEAMEVANNNGKSVAFLQIKFALPFDGGVGEVLRNAKNILLVENNSEAQMGGLIREKTGVEIEKKLLKYDGRPISASEILESINNYV